ncbi:hypothetical protein BCR32DRAFT_297671 [Anaeromyces robustus]|uniref:Transmembrane protein 107 n=1 Tax=Anaeromyces robustus TaxID=1754192 RepID=A0A1Y1VWT7_9FUNG|nr:hypothetical protein BCR32DRAFT_297671 [Anaeromyces robustus]|eukprot:ORX65767.1 hypothetical protein BCR32DRAFT_297671 [Anaeromyces robustus]
MLTMKRHTAAGTIIPSRFLATIAHIIASIMVFITKEGNIRHSLPLVTTQQSYSYVNKKLTVYIILSWFCFVVELFGFFSGITMFNGKANIIHSFLHAIATILISCFIIERWHFIVYLYIFSFCSIIPALIESCLIIKSFVFHVIRY